MGNSLHSIRNATRLWGNPERVVAVYGRSCARLFANLRTQGKPQSG